MASTPPNSAGSPLASHLVPGVIPVPPKPRHIPGSTPVPRPGAVARSKGRTLSSCRIGAWPILNQPLQRMRLEEFLRAYLPRPDRRCRVAPALGVTLLLKNVLLCREPLYGGGEW